MSSVWVRDARKRFATGRPQGRGGAVGRWPAREEAVPEHGPVVALDGVTLDVADGEALAILGPSGCGKSTLLRAVAGLEPLDDGHVYFDGEDVTQIPAQQRGVGMVFQSYALYPHMDSKRNLGFFFKMHRREPETESRVAAVCEVMGPGFRDLLNRRPSELSGGQQQRVAIGRCVIREPRVFLFDEPLSNLDAKLRVHTRVEIKRLIRRFGITSVYVTHDQTEAFAICERIAVMREGKVEQVGSYQQLMNRPATAFVARFLGTPPMSLLAACVGADARTLVLGANESELAASLPLPDPYAGRLAPRTPVTVGLRPDALRAARPEEPSSLRGRVVMSEPVLAARQQLVTCALGPAIGARGPEVTVRIEGTDRLPPGTFLPLAVDLDRLHLFDATGRHL